MNSAGIPQTSRGYLLSTSRFASFLSAAVLAGGLVLAWSPSCNVQRRRGCRRPVGALGSIGRQQAAAKRSARRGSECLALAGSR
jgi:hypothetical protein